MWSPSVAVVVDCDFDTFTLNDIRIELIIEIQLETKYRSVRCETATLNSVSFSSYVVTFFIFCSTVLFSFSYHSTSCISLNIRPITIQPFVKKG